MPVPDNKKTEEGNAQPTEKEQTLQEQLTKIQETMEQQKALSELQKDPNFIEYLKLKAEGKEVLVSEKRKEEEQKDDPLAELDKLLAGFDDGGDDDSDDDPETESSDQRKSESMKTFMGELTETLKTQLLAPMQSLSTEVEAIKQSREADELKAEQSKLQADLTTAVEKYPDFQDYKDDMGTIWEENKNLTVNDIYLLAKARRVGVTPHATETERPSLALSRPRTERPEKVRLGARGFTDMCNDAFAKRGR